MWGDIRDFRRNSRVLERVSVSIAIQFTLFLYFFLGIGIEWPVQRLSYQTNVVQFPMGVQDICLSFRVIF